MLYSALALGFRPPTAETLARLAVPAAARALADAARALERSSGAEGLSEAAAALAGPGVRLDALAAEHRRLFGHTAQGEVTPYETEYGDEALFQQPQDLSDLAGFMRAFGLTVRAEAHERVDHVSCECEFVGFLAFKQAYALQAGDGQMLAATQRATMLFLRAHLARFAPAFARQLQRAAARRWYGALADLLLALVLFDCRRVQVPIGSERLGLRPDPSAVAAPMGCAAAADCPAAQRES